MDIGITDSAREKIAKFLEAEGADGKPLRLAIVRTHCMGGRGYGYGLQAADDKRADDAVATSNGLSLLVDPASARLLETVEIDYIEGFEESGFRVTNSRARGKCPCGHHDLFD